MSGKQTYFLWNGSDITWYMHKQQGKITEKLLKQEEETLKFAKEQYNIKGGPLASSNVEASSCEVTDDGLRLICGILIDQRIEAVRLKFFDNRISKVGPIIRYLESRSGRHVKEIHLSHNYLDDAECGKLIEACARNRQKNNNPSAVWLRIEQNNVQNPESCVTGKAAAGKVARVKGIHMAPRGSYVALHLSFFNSTGGGKRLPIDGQVARYMPDIKTKEGLTKALNSELRPLAPENRKRANLSEGPGAKKARVDVTPLPGGKARKGGKGEGKGKGKGKNTAESDDDCMIVTDMGSNLKGEYYFNVETLKTITNKPAEPLFHKKAEDGAEEFLDRKPCKWLQIFPSEFKNEAMAALFPHLVKST